MTGFKLANQYVNGKTRFIEIEIFSLGEFQHSEVCPHGW
jgi:hypothetical protein